jgi:hypothetical protein
MFKENGALFLPERQQMGLRPTTELIFTLFSTTLLRSSSMFMENNGSLRPQFSCMGPWLATGLTDLTKKFKHNYFQIISASSNLT